MPQFFSEFFIKINGQDVSKDFMDDVLEVMVDTSLYLPEMFSILLQDTDLIWADDTSLLDLGKEVEISAEASEQFGGATGKLIKGEILRNGDWQGKPGRQAGQDPPLHGQPLGHFGRAADTEHQPIGRYPGPAMKTAAKRPQWPVDGREAGGGIDGRGKWTGCGRQAQGRHSPHGGSKSGVCSL